MAYKSRENEANAVEGSIFGHEFTSGAREGKAITFSQNPAGHGGAGGNSKELMTEAKDGNESARRRIGLYRPGDPGFNQRTGECF